MPRLRIAVDLSDAPNILRSILAETLAGIPDAEIEDLAGQCAERRVDAVLVCAERASLAILNRGQADRLIAVTPSGARVTVHRPGRAPQVLHDASPDRIRELLTNPVPDRPGLLGWLYGLFHGPPRVEAPAPPGAGDALSACLGRIAARILAHRGDRVPDVGPGRELRDLVRQLAGDGPAPKLPGLERLVSVFALDPTERDLILLGSLVEVDLRAARLLTLLNDHMGRPRPMAGLAAELGLPPERLDASLGPEGRLVRFGLATVAPDGPLATADVTVPPAVWRLVLGGDRAPTFPLSPADPQAIARLKAPESLRPVLEAAATALAGAAQVPAVAVLGPEDSGRGAIATALAGRLGHAALAVPGTVLAEPGGLGTVLRELCLEEAALVLTAPEAVPEAVWPALMGGLPAPAFLIAEPARYGALAMACDRPLMRLDAPPRDPAQRLRLWAAGTGPQPGGVDDDGLRRLAERFDFGPRGIARARRIAEAQARAEGRAAASAADLSAACDRLRQTRFDGAAERLPCPWTRVDIVLPDRTRAELDLAIAWARHGQQLFGEGGPGAGLRAGAGLSCLFSGPPGTGKTMAAQIIAAEVDYALYRIDLSQVVDKFIGESEKRLAAVFDEAERSRVALFFDEADALFGKRTEVRDSHDRYANITIDYLLQRLDDFDGLAILATNLAGNIDDAFLRRIRVRAEFMPPAARERRAIWDKLLPPPEDRANDIDIPQLAEPFEIVGGEIRNAIYTALLLSAEEGAPLSMRHCVRGLWRELEKIGRMSDRSRLGSWQAVLPPGR
ncbi:ATP-binding protein [Maribius pontilimi]|uniref:ATP-binding protein n=1 Tax=Palleronia pontilimi TaxID=1964209 RepID=A0A934MB71_9RHOB|nr:ATP-binding protein [Palleronia pontilimi]MBJ3764432.1 ATP-binding protein [Palleronia pontilimi]